MRCMLVGMLSVDLEATVLASSLNHAGGFDMYGTLLCTRARTSPCSPLPSSPSSSLQCEHFFLPLTLSMRSDADDADADADGGCEDDDEEDAESAGWRGGISGPEEGGSLNKKEKKKKMRKKWN